MWSLPKRKIATSRETSLHHNNAKLGCLNYLRILRFTCVSSLRSEDASYWGIIKTEQSFIENDN